MTNSLFNKRAESISTLAVPTQPKFEYKTLGPLAPDEPLIQLVYGPQGSGKTWYGGSASPRLLIINIGDGLVTLKSPLYRQLYPDIKDALVVDLNEHFTGDHKVQPKAFDLVCSVIDDAIKHKRDKFDTILLDDGSTLNWFASTKGVEINRVQQGKSSTFDRYVWTDVADKGKEMDIILWFLREYTKIFKSNGINFILTAHERQIFGKPSKIGDEAPLRYIKPGFTGKTQPDLVPAFFDEVWHLEMKHGGSGKFSKALTGGNSMITGKTRHNGIFAESEDNPDFLKVLSRIRKGELHKSYVK